MTELQAEYWNVQMDFYREHLLGEKFKVAGSCIVLIAFSCIPEVIFPFTNDFCVKNT